MKKYIPLILSLFCFQSLAEGISVITHPSANFNIQKEDIVKLFTGRSQTFPDGRNAVPINFTESKPIRLAFDDKVIGRSSSQLKAYWSKLMFTGKGTPPKEVESVDEMIQLISKNPNIIGYISSGDVTDDVKVVFSIE